MASSYHHGDLKKTLVRVGLEVLAEDGVQALSLRKVARRAGVSHNAPYMHFADKEALLAAIAEEGFRRLEKEMCHAADATPGGSLAQLVAVSRGYVTFALGHPQHFAVMFTDFREGDYPALNEAALGTFARLVETLTACQAAGVVRSGDPREMAAGVWAMMHGLATLLAAERLSPSILEPRPREDVSEGLLQLLFEGLRKHGLRSF